MGGNSEVQDKLHVLLLMHHAAASVSVVLIFESFCVYCNLDLIILWDLLNRVCMSLGP